MVRLGVGLSALALVVAGCGADGTSSDDAAEDPPAEAPSDGPAVMTFLANPPEVDCSAGDAEVTVTWTTQDVTRMELSTGTEAPFMYLGGPQGAENVDQLAAGATSVPFDCAQDSQQIFLNTYVDDGAAEADITKVVAVSQGSGDGSSSDGSSSDGSSSGGSSSDGSSSGGSSSDGSSSDGSSSGGSSSDGSSSGGSSSGGKTTTKYEEDPYKTTTTQYKEEYKDEYKEEEYKEEEYKEDPKKKPSSESGGSES